MAAGTKPEHFCGPVVALLVLFNLDAAGGTHSLFTADEMKPIDQAIYEKVISQRNDLMRLAPDQLRRLPEYSKQEFSPCGTKQLFAIWHHKTKLNEDIFVVQCKRYIFLGYGHMFAEGFVLDASDRVREAEEELMWDYR